jgi:hypothetical protein
VSFLFGGGGHVMAKGKYEEWLTPEGLVKLEGWARDGLTDEQIAENMGIKRQTLYEWKKKYADISDTLKRGKEVIDRHVENALLKRALGYRYDEVTREPQPVIDKKTGKIKKDEFGEPVMELQAIKVVTKEVQPDTTAQIFWLKNRKPEVWRDKQEINHSGGTDNTVTVVFDEGMNDE